jgi:CspA family cold shock protein
LRPKSDEALSVFPGRTRGSDAPKKLPANVPVSTAAHVYRVGVIPWFKGINMTIGTVKFFNAAKGFGFISPQDGGKDVFVHISAVEAAGLRTLNEGQKVNFDIQPDARGSKAANLSAA